MTTESLLRKELRELADVAPPTGLADHTLAAARLRRQRRWAVGGVGIAAVVSVVLATTLVGHDKPRHRSTTDPVVIHPAGGDSKVVASYVVSSVRSPGSPETWVLDPRTGRYVRVSTVAGQRFNDLVISPDGRNALVSVTDRQSVGKGLQWAVIPVAALAEGRGSELHRLPDLPAFYGHSAGPMITDISASWSHDGRKVLLVSNPGPGSYGFRIYDVRSGALGSIRPLPVLSTDVLMAWGRTDDEVALSPLGQSWGGAKSTTIRFFSAKDGHQTGQLIPPDALETTGMTNEDPQPISPDGRHALGPNSGVVDLGTLRLWPMPPPRSGRAAREMVSWYGNQHYVVEQDDVTLLLVNMKAMPVRSMRLPIGTSSMPSGEAGTQVDGLRVQLASASAYPAGSGVRF